MADFKPHLPNDTHLKDFSYRSLIVGAIFGILFGCTNAYLGLKAGITVSAAIPVAIIATALFKSLESIWGKASILEANIAQTTGSAGSSLASGIIFTIPALFLWGFEPPVLQIAAIGLFGGMLGILFMIPFRRFLIVKERINLPYPEGTASAQVLIATNTGGNNAKYVFMGLGIGAVYKACISFIKLWPSKVQLALPGTSKALLGIETTPALLGVGYILGFRTSTILVSGGLLSWMIIIPAIGHLGGYLSHPLLDTGGRLLSEMPASFIWKHFIRYVGAGSLAAAGMITVCKSMPVIVSSLRMGLRELLSTPVLNKAPRSRIDSDLPFFFIIAVTILFLGVGGGSSFIFGSHHGLSVRILGTGAVLIFAFLFVIVSSRVVGLIGVSSNPTSGMAIVTLVCVSIFFYAKGWTDDLSKMTVLIVGAVVTIAASMAGAFSQDLRSGHMLGATPKKQQLSEIFGALTSAFIVAFAVVTLGKVYGFGSNDLAAPQAMLMKTVIDGVMQTDLPWTLILVGVLFSCVAELCGISSLPFALGVYLPLSTMTPVFLGGLLNFTVFRMNHRKKTSDFTSKQTDTGVLLGSGLIAGEGITGILIAAYAIFMGNQPGDFIVNLQGGMGGMVSFFMFCLLGLFLFMVARSGGSGEN